MVPGRTYGSRDVARILWARKWWVLVPIVAASVLAVQWAMSLPDIYRSEALILVVPRDVTDVQHTVDAPVTERLSAIADQILSRSNLEPIIREFNLHPQASAPMEALVEVTRANVEVMTAGGETFRLAFSHTDPQLARDVTARLAALFTGGQFLDRVQIAESAFAFLDAETDRARHRLVEQEQRLDQFRRRFATQLPSQVNSNLQLLQNTQQELRVVRQSIDRDVERRRNIQRMISDVRSEGVVLHLSEGVVADRALASPAYRLAAAREELGLSRLRLTSEHPDILRLEQEILNLEDDVERERKQASALAADDGAASFSPPRSAAELSRANRERAFRAELVDLEQRIEESERETVELETLRDRYQARVEAVPRLQGELAQITRDYDTAERTYRDLLARKDEAGLAAELEQRQLGQEFALVDAPQIPVRAVAPNRRNIAITGTLFGLVLSLGLVVLLESLDSSLRTEEEVLAALQLPVLASVPVIITGDDVSLGRTRAIIRLLIMVMLTSLVVAAAFLWPPGSSLVN